MEDHMRRRFNPADHREFIGGSDARIIMGADEAALLRLWREKRGEAEPEDLSTNLIVQLGLATEDLRLFPVFMRFLEAYAWPSAVFIDDLDAGRFKGATDHVESRASGLAEPCLQLMHCHDANGAAWLRHLSPNSASTAESKGL
jgi:hypothetical protein